MIVIGLRTVDEITGTIPKPLLIQNH